MAKKGRKSFYETIIKPNLPQIAELVKKGLLEKEIYEALGVSKTVWYEAKLKHAEFADVLNCRHRLEAVEKLEAAALKAACGYTYKETRKIYKPNEEDVLGAPVLAAMEVTEKHQPANNQLNRYLLQNWGREYGYTADPLQHKLRSDELEWRKAQKQPPDWDDDAGGV